MEVRKLTLVIIERMYQENNVGETEFDVTDIYEEVNLNRVTARNRSCKETKKREQIWSSTEKCHENIILKEKLIYKEAS